MVRNSRPVQRASAHRGNEARLIMARADCLRIAIKRSDAIVVCQIFNMKNELAFITLGNEYDKALRKCLMRVLQSFGATQIDGSRGIGGSPEIEMLRVDLDGDTLGIEAKTFVGLNISGPGRLAEKVARLVKDEMDAETNGIDRKL